MAETIEAARRAFAQELRRIAYIKNERVVAAFAAAPREDFLGPGPWLVRNAPGKSGDARSAADDPRRLYQDALVALDAERGINNGQPSLWAALFDRLDLTEGAHVLHLGCGTGYYTAILAEIVGPRGRIVALEIEPALAERARAALAPWPWVEVLNADASVGPFEAADAIIVSAGANYPPPAWLAAVRPGGRLMFPLTASDGLGVMAFLRRVGDDWFEARLEIEVAFYAFSGARSAAVDAKLVSALRADRGASVRSLRCDPHDAAPSCWLHGEGWCFSRCEPGSAPR